MFTAALVVSALLSLRVLASVLAEPLEVAAAASAPTWQVQVTTNTNSPGIVLAYGPEVGVQLLRIPAREAGGTDNARDSRAPGSRGASPDHTLAQLSACGGPRCARHGRRAPERKLPDHHRLPVSVKVGRANWLVSGRRCLTMLAADERIAEARCARNDLTARSRSRRYAACRY